MRDGSTAAATPFLQGAQSFASIGGAIAGVPLGTAGFGRWWLAVAGSLGLLGLLAVSLLFLFVDGVAIWGNNIPVTWALDIVSYDWWIGIACGGLLVSGVLLLLDVEWRGALNRIAETMALLAAAAAAIYPIIHLGRPWFFYWNLPYPNSFGLWPQFRSPLYWDAIDIVSFLGLAASFWYVGLLPDLANLRDRAAGRIDEHGGGLLRARLYGIAALGWRGSAVHWHRWVQAYRLLALLGVLVVVALQTGAAVMFAGTLEPGWHDTLLPVSYLAGAVFAGVGMLSVLSVVIRAAFHLEALITPRHVQVLAMLMLVLCLANLYCLGASTFTTLLGGDSFEIAAQIRRATGPVAWSFWLWLMAALLPPLLFVWPAWRRSPRAVAWTGGGVAAGIWGDHYTLIVATLQHDFLPAAVHSTRISFFEWATFLGSAGIFLFLLLIFLRLLPILSIVETRGLASGIGGGAAVARPWPRHASPDWGVAAEFASPDQMADAIKSLRGCTGLRIDGFSPVPVRAAARALGLNAGMGMFAVLGFAAGFAAMFGMCAYATTSDYVFNIGGRPLFSWPAFIVPSVSFGCLCAGLTVMGAMLVLNRLPRLSHPVFNIAGILRASEDRFFVVASGHGEAEEFAQAERVLTGLRPPALAVTRVAQ